MYILREANSIDDFDAFLALKSQKDAVKWSGFETAPDPDRFRQYYIEKVLNNPKTHVLFICDADEEGCPIVAYNQYDDITPIEVEIRGTVIKRQYQGTDAMEALNRLTIEHHINKGHKTLITWASEKNVVSVANMINEGFIQTDIFDVRNLPLLGGEHRFFKFIKEL